MRPSLVNNVKRLPTNFSAHIRGDVEVGLDAYFSLIAITPSVLSYSQWTRPTAS